MTTKTTSLGVEKILSDFRREIAEIRKSNSPRADNRLNGLRAAVNKLGRPTATRRDTTAADIFKRAEAGDVNARSVVRQVAGEAVFKAAMGGNIHAQQVVREAVEMAAKAGADEVGHAQKVYAESVTGKRAPVLKAGTARPLPGPHDPVAIPAGDMPPMLAFVLQHAANTGTSLSADELPPQVQAAMRAAGKPGEPAPDIAAWMNGPGKVALDPATFRPIQTPLQRGSGTGS